MVVVVAPAEAEEVKMAVIVIREFDPKKDSKAVEEVERRCELDPSGGLSIITDLLGDPICRVRNSPAYIMLVAEMVVMSSGDNNNNNNNKYNIKKEHREMVGMIRGCIKTVSCGKRFTTRNDSPIYTKLAYILGLRVSPFHRRNGIGLKLVCRIEEWFRENGAIYSYMATEVDNHASIKLFTEKCGYLKFRTPSILVQPIFAHRVRVSTQVTIVKLSPFDAGTLYRRRFSTTEFFPRDIVSILNNKLSLGTFVAYPKAHFGSKSWPGSDEFLASPPKSWVVLSVWNCKNVFKLEVRGASLLKKISSKTTRLVDQAFPWLQLPSVPEIFSPFGIHFLYGLGGEGPHAVKLMKTLCSFAHNLAKDHSCGLVATEVASRDPLKQGIPHWESLSCPMDLWCIKRLEEGKHCDDVDVYDWTKTKPEISLFVDPREI